MVNVFYPRVISIYRENQDGVVGAQAYSGIQQLNQTSIATNVPAHIELDRTGNRPDAKLPADAAGQSMWKIIVKLPLGTIQARDFINDEIGNSYQVISVDWKPLSTTCRCQIMET